MKNTRRNILLVDDDPDFLNMAQEVLQTQGYQVTTKTNGYAALTAINSGIPVDLVIVDHNMPGMDGLKFLTAMGKKTLSLPIIMLSGHGSAEVYIKALHLGAYEFINKPVRLRDLTTVITSALNRQETDGHLAFDRAKKTVNGGSHARERGKTPNLRGH